MTPFIVIGMPRTGSTLLLTGIMQHPQIIAYGELMHPTPLERHFTHAIKRGDKLVSFNPAGDAINFLKEEVFESPFSTGKKATGFKLFGDYVKCPGTEKLFARLWNEVEGLRVVHIVRPNHLDSLISLRMARATGKWERRRGEEQPHRTVTIPAEDAQMYFERMRETDRWMGSYFKGDRYYKIEYDTLAATFATELYKVYKFLGADEYIPSKFMEKQIERPRHEVVDNYSDLLRHFSGTPYASFFSA